MDRTIRLVAPDKPRWQRGATRTLVIAGASRVALIFRSPHAAVDQRRVRAGSAP
jgi:hypothetical protein